ncbi:hypothetical protein RGT17_05790 [Bacillus altitudinis]|uniref:hypothetical protein n=1 Tax=Bacillus pumilus TaxID=1408 RepID=UPI0025A21821|nr:hypothetical protein [Bacillus pumilus]MDM5321809.1 hypothetical protein [Bacillus pumilus]MDR4994742.1 hypothetical protein [Bacillus altitudinis]
MRNLFILLLIISITVIAIVVFTGGYKMIVGKLIVVFSSTLAATSIMKIVDKKNQKRKG